MKNLLFQSLLFAIVLLSVQPGKAQSDGALSFTQWFDEGVMRIDLVFTGTSDESTYAFESLRKEPFFSGSRKRLLDPFDYGDHKFEVSDSATGILIFSQTYCTLFREWQTTTEAASVARAYSHVIRFPWPKKSVTVDIYDRDDPGEFQLSWTGHFNPGSIYADPTLSKSFEVVDLEIHGPTENKVDLLFLAEGYTADEMDKFIEDARRSADFIFSEEPFLEQQGSIQCEGCSIHK